MAYTEYRTGARFRKSHVQKHDAARDISMHVDTQRKHAERELLTNLRDTMLRIVGLLRERMGMTMLHVTETCKGYGKSKDRRVWNALAPPILETWNSRVFG